ncbi:MAG: hypothetical protein ABS75_03525 [Pelagibacterium sp. SCN 63-23]|nr:MAG: hypothetical protein ABS75_03525 [Pelagibacterium sp. SCN 63-23]
MPIAGLSRWTATYFALALCCLVLALALLATGFGYPSDDVMAPETLIVVHLVAIGWLTLLMCGALFQFVPVLVAAPQHNDFYAPLALLLLVTGLVLLLDGFSGFAGLPLGDAQAMPLGGLVLSAGFAVVVAKLARIIWAAQPLALSARLVLIGLAALLLTALLGESLASALTGLLPDDIAAALVSAAVPLHAASGLGGWLTLTAIGVSYRLLSMFLLAPDPKGWRPRMVFWASLACVALLAAHSVAIIVGLPITALPVMIIGTAILVIVVYAVDFVLLYHSRRRRQLELHAKGALAAFLALLVGTVGLLAGVSGAGVRLVPAAIHLLAFGWLGGLGLAMLYKIIPFLTWLECFAPVMGRRPTPRVQDLVDESQAAPWLWLYFLALAIASAALAADLQLAFRAASVLQLLGTIMLIREFYRSRRLANIPGDLRSGDRPRLFLPSAS